MMRLLLPALAASLAAVDCRVTPLAGHGHPVLAVADAGEGLVATCDGAMRLWDAGSGRLRWLQDGEPMSTRVLPEITMPAVVAVAGDRIVAGWAGQTEVLDRRSGRVLGRAALTLSSVTPDAAWAVSTGSGGVGIHPSGDLARSALLASTDSFDAVTACSGDSRTVWACGYYHGKLLRIERGESGWSVAATYPAPPQNVDALAVVPLAGGGDALAVALEVGGKVVVDLHALPYDPAAKPRRSAELPTYGSQFRIVLRPAGPGRLLAWARGAAGVHEIDVATGELRTIDGEGSGVGAAARLGGATAIASGQEVRILGADGQARCVLAAAGRAGAVDAMLRSPDGRLLWTGSPAGVACWDLALLRQRGMVAAAVQGRLQATACPGVARWGSESAWHLVALDGRSDLGPVAADPQVVPVVAADGSLAVTVAAGALTAWRLPQALAGASVPLPAWEQTTVATWLGISGDGRSLLVLRRGEREVWINGGRETAPSKHELRAFALPGLVPQGVAVIPAPPPGEGSFDPPLPAIEGDGDGWTILHPSCRLRIAPDASVRATLDGPGRKPLPPGARPDDPEPRTVGAPGGPWFARLATAVDDLGFPVVTAPGGGRVRLAADGDAWAVWSADGAFDGSRSAPRVLAALLDGVPAALDEAAAPGNRPDRLLRLLGCDDPELLAAAARPADRRTGGDDAGRPAIKVVARRIEGGKLLLDLAAPGAVRLECWIDGVAAVARAADGSPAVPRADGAATLAVPLDESASRVEVAAVDAAGRRSVRILETVPSLAAAPGRVVVACLGVSRYRQADLALRYAAKDALDLAFAFGDAGAQHLARAWVDEQVVVARLDEVRAHLAQAGPADTVVLTLAGHGLYAGEPRPAWVFLPWDADPARPAETGIAWTRIAALFDGCRARNRLVVLDACESGDLDGDLPPAAGLAVPGARGLRGGAVAAVGAGLAAEFRASDRSRFVTADLALGSGAVVLASSRGGESSFESESDRNGLFTAALLAGLRGAADGFASVDGVKDGRISADELVRWTAQEVARRSGGRQRPTIDRDNPAAAILLPVLPPAE